jgi:hypothetical protein
MGLALGPKSSLAARVLPGPLYKGLRHVFGQGIYDCMLVGGTALSGYYAGHRRSDDLDLFTADGPSQEAAVTAVKSLREIGAGFAEERSSARFYHATCHLEDHDFTSQVVLDSNLFEVGSRIEAGDGVVVADLNTLLKMKAATLVSRGAEKDLYDLAWLFEQDRDLDVPALVALGSEIDGGMNAEAVLINLVGTTLSESACGFSLTEGTREVYDKVTRLRSALIQGLDGFLRGQPPPPIAALIRKLG